jgi:ComF family protein
VFNVIRDSLLSLVFPQQCKVCNGPVEHMRDGVACADCWAKTRFFDGSEMRCAKCGSWYGDAAAPTPVYCHKCDEHNYDRAFALGIYEKALAAAILELKRSPSLPARLRTELSSAGAILPNADVLVPVPLSKERRLERGFNQAEIIAYELGKATGIPIDAHSVERHLPTHIHRVGMDDKARELSVRNVFSVKRPNLIAGKRILLVDDVLTSGATASNCAKVLKKHGASEVNIFTLARAVMRSY